MSSFVAELKRRNVFRVGAAYLALAWVVIEITDIAVPALNLPETLTSIVFYLGLIGFPFALLFAWAFELTPDGLVKTEDVKPEHSVTSDTGRKLEHMIVGLLVVAVLFLVWDNYWDERLTDDPVATEGSVPTVPMAATQASIAVLPFVNMSADADQEYFSDGISEEILNVLAKIPGLHVTSRSSAFAFKGKDIDIPSVARQLGVTTVLEGSVRKSGTKVRITAQLIDAKTDRHLWSESYDRELVDIFAIQDEISAAIVSALRVHLNIDAVPAAIAERRLTSNADAYEAYLRGRHLIIQRTRSTLEGAIREFEAAIRFDADFAAAHAQLAIAHMLLVNDQYGNRTFDEVQASATPHADKAMMLDPKLAESQAAAGFVLWHTGASHETLSYFEEALRLSPGDAQVSNWMSIIYEESGDYSKTLAMRERILQIDPLFVANLANLVGNYDAVGRRAEAEKALAKLLVISPTSHAESQALLRWNDGKTAEAAFGFLRALTLDPNLDRARLFFGEILADMGLEADAVLASDPPRTGHLLRAGRHQDVIDRLITVPDVMTMNISDRNDLGRAYAALGDYATALPILESVWQENGRIVSRWGLFGAMDAAALIASRRAADRLAPVDDVIDAMHRDAANMRAAGIILPDIEWTDGLATWFAGDRAAAFRHLAEAARKNRALPQHQDFLTSLYADPGFAATLAAHAAFRLAERGTFLNVVCGDNRYAAVWQPQPETCAAHAAGAGD